MDQINADNLALRELIEDWVVYRDACLWDEFRKVWHDDGVMMATWFQGTADQFIAVSKAGFEKGVRILHFLGGCSIRTAGDRAISQTKMTINQRAGAAGEIAIYMQGATDDQCVEVGRWLIREFNPKCNIPATPLLPKKMKAGHRHGSTLGPIDQRVYSQIPNYPLSRLKQICGNGPYQAYMSSRAGSA
jgi:hypothetical protein